jgi:hypothetical protein
MWNSGRLVSISPTVSPGPIPSAARQRAAHSTSAPYSLQLSAIAPSPVRSAGSSEWTRTVRWNASQIVSGLAVCIAAGAVAG